MEAEMPTEWLIGLVASGPGFVKDPARSDAIGLLHRREVYNYFIR
jgi:hypothetical protein